MKYFPSITRCLKQQKQKNKLIYLHNTKNNSPESHAGTEIDYIIGFDHSFADKENYYTDYCFFAVGFHVIGSCRETEEDYSKDYDEENLLLVFYFGELEILKEFVDGVQFLFYSHIFFFEF